jgi:hypothetical protein
MKAFPTLKDNGHITTQDGMDMLDWFAGMALTSIAAQRIEIDDSAIEIAELAYALAHAMMEVRNR